MFFSVSNYVHAQYDWTTRVPDNGNEWRKFPVVPRLTSCVPLFCSSFHLGGNRRAFRLLGEGGDHFHCTVEPSPGHIRCRIWQTLGATPGPRNVPGTNRICPWDKPTSSPGTRPGFLLLWHNGSPVCPRDKPRFVPGRNPGTKHGRKRLCVKSLCAFLAPKKSRETWQLSAPSPGNDLRSKSAIRLCGQNCTQRFFKGFIARPPTLNKCKWCPEACPDSRRRRFFAATIRLRSQCILRWKMANFASHRGNSLRFRLRFKNRLRLRLRCRGALSLADVWAIFMAGGAQPLPRGARRKTAPLG